MSTEVIVSELMELIQSQIADSAGESLSAKEERALAIGRRAAELAMSEMIAVDPTEPLCVTCECGGIALSKQSRSRSVVTMAGTHKISRRSYHCEGCGNWLAPRDEKLGIGSGSYSVGVVALVAEVSAGFAFEAGEDFLARRFGLDLCYKQVQRLAEHTGAVMYEKEYGIALGVISDEVVLVSEECPDMLTMSADGVMVHSDGAWTEMKCASFLSEEHGRSTIATMERSEKFGEFLYLEAVRRGLRRANKVVFVADGAVWIWNLVAHHFPDHSAIRLPKRTFWAILLPYQPPNTRPVTDLSGDRLHIAIGTLGSFQHDRSGSRPSRGCPERASHAAMESMTLRYQVSRLWNVPPAWDSSRSS